MNIKPKISKMAVYKYKKNGGLDKRTKEGKQAQKIENFFTFCKSGLGRFIIGLIGLAILLEILGLA
jgi:hypothetical protein